MSFQSIILKDVSSLSGWRDRDVLTLTIVDTKSRTSAARCSRMIPSSSSSIFSEELEQSMTRGDSVCECDWRAAGWDMGVSLQRDPGHLLMTPQRREGRC